MFLTWNSYRTAQIKLHQYIITFLDLLGDLTALFLSPEVIQERRQKSILIIEKMADKILETIPYALGDMWTQDNSLQINRPSTWADALRLLWPLCTVRFSPLMLSRQREVAETALCRIGYRKGFTRR